MQTLLGLLPSSGLETAIGVDPEQVLGQDLDHGGDSVLDLLLSRNSGGVNVVHTGADLVRVSVVSESLEQLQVRLGSFNGDDVGVQSLDGREDVGKVRVTEVRVHLGRVLDAGSGESERVDSPGQVVVPVNLSQGKTLSDGRLVDLDGVDTSVLQVDDFVSEGQGQLLGLNLSRDIGSGEGPVQDGNGSSQHTLHGLLGDGLGVLGPSDGHGLRSGDVGDDDRGSDVSGSVRLDPTELGEDESVQLFTKVLDHVVSLGFTVDEQVQSDLLLESNDLFDFVLHGLFVVLLGELVLVELGSGSSDLLGLGERTNGSGGELGQVQVGLLGLSSLREGRLSLEHFRGNGGQSVTDGRVRGSLELPSGRDVLGVLLEVFGFGTADGLGQRSDFLTLFEGERQPGGLLGGQSGLGGQGDRGVEQRRRSSDDDSVGTQLADSLLGDLLGGGQVSLPDVSTGNDTKFEDELGGLDGGDNILELVRRTVQVNVERVNGQLLDKVDRLADSAKVGGEGDLGCNLGQLLVGLGVFGRQGLSDILNEDRLVDLNVLNTGFLQLLQSFNVDGQERIQSLEGLEASGCVSGSLRKSQEGNGSEEDGSGNDTVRLGLLELLERLVSVKLELGVGRDFGDDKVVVGVEPLLHLTSLQVNALVELLSASAHGWKKIIRNLRKKLINASLTEGDVKLGKTVLGVSLGDGVEHDRVVQDVVVEGEVTAGKGSALQ